MAERTGALLLDTDVLVLLSVAGVLDEVASLLGYAPSQMRRLPASVYQVQRSKKFAETYAAPVLASIVQSLRKIDETTESEVGDLELLNALNAAMDVGEAQLIATASATEGALLVSGDKRAVRNLARSQVHTCIAAMQNRIVCLEAALWMLVQKNGAAQTRRAFMHALNHKTVRILLSESMTCDQQCLDGIASFFEDLHKDAKGLLFNPAPSILACRR
ncbi:hypothetical protein [Sinimarinibacterium sp. NLF-5-8]|uniref:hypothetical protein n=1 Tax=Sinimarinibacterium sp. NLF-5-8 TaxID=2698684 RepID=UPI00137BD7E8|nr:hypothetical protein [Sinimarinibacterium sp. NLF-5-8]QHS09106.1 hypothetical protein GT972_02360 [Sinimarinibacterium sp. NLF-5-8]